MNYTTILKCGLFLVIFFTPLIGFSFFMDFYYVSLMTNATEEIEQTKLVFHYIFNIGLVLFTLVALLGISGVFRVLRNLIWGEGLFFKDDFTSGIKQNFKKNTAFAAIFSVFYLLAYFVYSILPESAIAYFGLVMFALIFVPIYFWMMLLNNTYNSTWFGLLKNGMFFYIKTIGWSLLAAVIIVSPVCLIFIPMEFVWAKYIALILIIVFVFPIIFLIMILYSTSKFDLLINKDNYPDFYCRGLNI